MSEIKVKIQDALLKFKKGKLSENAIALFQTLGYNTERQAPLEKQDYPSFKSSFVDGNSRFNEDTAMKDDWNYVDLLFQLSQEEMSKQHSAFKKEVVTKEDGSKIAIESYLFFAIELKEEQYSRTNLSHITREVNRLFPMPVMILFKYGSLLTLSIINRRLHKRDENKDVLEKITLIKDINIENPHRAHIEILFDLSFEELKGKHRVTNFVELHDAWQKTLDLKELNKQFYQKLFNWYLWALPQVNFPQIRPEKDKVKDNVHQSESLIRLLTRLLFVWFMKEKGLINPALFDVNKLSTILKDFKEINGDETIYYKAILQNLFFATLNKPIEQRKVIDKGYNPKEYGDPLVYRFDDLFHEPENFLSHFKNIPFLNGGLFECLDQKKDKDNPDEIRMDGFSTKKFKQAVLPDKLFFGKYKDTDLSQEYDDKKKNKLTVYGLIDILHQYKFTIEENTPIEEEIALDPELLGKIFENLLASYNPETKTTARKATGSFYTPREIVNYMVDESLFATFQQKLSDAGITENVEQRLRELISYNETENQFTEKETSVIIQALENLKVFDPACGSGAFPMGILHKLVWVLRKVDPENKKWFKSIINHLPDYTQAEMRKKLEDENWDYLRKLGIIQQSIYGVDIQPIAIQIAKLRFFISLLVDQDIKNESDNFGLMPLPNLDFKLVSANTLISAPKSDVIKIGLFENQTDPFFEEFNRLTGQYFSASMPKDKKELKNKIVKLISEKCNEKIRQIESKYESTDERVSKALKEKHKTFIDEKEQEIELWQSYTNLFKYESVGFFEPRYFFPKATDGFDVVIGNPPWIQSKILSPEDKRHYQSYYKTAIGQYDLFNLFIEKGIGLLTSNGRLTFITPDRFITNLDYKYVREYLLKNTCLKEITSLGDDIFENVAMPSAIIHTENLKQKNEAIKCRSYFSSDFSLKNQNDFLQNENFIFKIFGDSSVDLLLKSISEKSDKLVDHLTNARGVEVGKDSEVIEYNFRKGLKKFLRGEDINRYQIKASVFIDTSYSGVDYKDDSLYQGTKILIRKTGSGIIAVIDDEYRYVIQTIYIFKHNHSSSLNERYVLGCLNSKLMGFWYNYTFGERALQTILIFDKGFG